MKKSINPTTHGIINYLFAGLLLAGPKLLKLKGLARALSYGLGSSVTSAGAMTDHPGDVQRKIPFQIHKLIDAGNLGALLLATGVLKQRRARYFFLGLLAAGVATVLLTDWKQEEKTS